MKKTLLFLLAAIAFVPSLWAQGSVTGVSTMPQNKVAIIEEFTGVRCPNCPPGHTILDNLITASPTTVFVVAYHPNNSSYTPPYSGDEDYQRSYPAAFYSTPFCGSSRFMPSAFINRREWSPNEKITSRTNWAPSANTIRTEMSPMNVGVLATYNEATMMLDVTVEVYYTANVTDQNSLYVTLAENGLVSSQQAGASGAYTHKHTFREALSAQWGDIITPTGMGDMVTRTFSFDNSTTQYDMSKCEVMAFVENKANEEIYTGYGANVAMPVAVADPSEGLNVQVFPNPVNERATLVFEMDDLSEVSYTISNLMGATIAQENLGVQGSGSHRIDLDTRAMGLSAGVYMIRVQAGERSNVQRIIVQ